MTISTKKLVLVNIILLFLIIIGFIGVFLFDKYIYVPYDPFDDPSEYERLDGERLKDSEIPDIVLNNVQSVVDEYSQSLNNKGIENIKIGKIISLLYKDGKYHFKYIIVNENTNRIIATLYFRYIKDGMINSVTAEYRYFSESDFLIYNNTLIGLESLNISGTDIYKIKNRFKSKIDTSWKLGNNYRYDYYKQGQLDGVYGGISDLKIFTIMF